MTHKTLGRITVSICIVWAGFSFELCGDAKQNTSNRTTIDAYPLYRTINDFPHHLNQGDVAAIKLASSVHIIQSCVDHWVKIGLTFINVLVVADRLLVNR